MGQLLATDVGIGGLPRIDVVRHVITYIYPVSGYVLELAYDWRARKLYGTWSNGGELGALHAIDVTGAGNTHLMDLPGVFSGRLGVSGL